MKILPTDGRTDGRRMVGYTISSPMGLKVSVCGVKEIVQFSNELLGNFVLFLGHL